MLDTIEINLLWFAYNIIFFLIFDGISSIKRVFGHVPQVPSHEEVGTKRILPSCTSKNTSPVKNNTDINY